MTEDLTSRRRREERHRSARWMGVIAVVVALGVALYLVLSGRGDDAATPPPTTPVTTPTTPTTTAPTTQSESPTTNPTTQTDTPTTDPTEDATAASDDPTDSGSPTFKPVDPADYHDEALGAYFFTAASEELRCGLFTDGKIRLSGCQATVVVPSLPECDDPDTNGPIVTIEDTGPAFPECTKQGIFIVEDAPELPVGGFITVGDITCFRDETVVACDNAKTGYGFRASLEEFAAVP